MIKYPIDNNDLPFSDYLQSCRAIIKEHRIDIQKNNAPVDLIIDANAPFEFLPTKPSVNGIKYGALLIHGLLDSPFSIKEVAKDLREHGVLCRSILLPGHGTRAQDLIDVNFQDWIDTVSYGVNSLKKEVDHLFLIGYSTGATLAINHALTDPSIRGIVLISPAIKVKAPLLLIVGWHRLVSLINNKNKDWIIREENYDYVKYTSVPFKAFYELNKLTDRIKEIYDKSNNPPILMMISKEDETVSSKKALAYFSKMTNPESKAIVYSPHAKTYEDKRIEVKIIEGAKNIKHYSHIGFPYSPHNPHYGIEGDFPFATNLQHNKFIFGAYNRLEVNLSNILYDLRLIRRPRRILTYNPDFKHMSHQIVEFILKNK